MMLYSLCVLLYKSSYFRCPTVTAKEHKSNITIGTHNDNKGSLYQYLQQLEEELKELLATKDTVSKAAKKMKMR